MGRVNSQITKNQKEIIKYNLNSAFAEYLEEDESDFNENILKVDVDKESLQAKILYDIRPGNDNPESDMRDLWQMFNTPEKWGLHKDSGGYKDVTKREVITETANQIDAMLENNPQDDSSVTTITASMFKKVKDVNTKLSTIEHIKESQWRQRIEEERQGSRQQNLVRRSVRTGLAAGISLGAIIGADYSDDNGEIEGFNAARAFAVAASTALFVGGVFYAGHVVGRRRNSENEEDVANDNVDELELAEIGQAIIAR